MKRIITIIFSLVLAMNTLAQRELGLDEITRSIGGYDWKRKVHDKGTYVIFQHTLNLKRSFRNMKGITDFINSKLARGEEAPDADSLKSRIDNEEKIYKETCARVRQMLDSLMETSEESYHFENHNRDIDTVNYSICLESNKSRKKSKDDWEFPDTTETLTFSMRSKETEIGKLIYFHILHKRIEYADYAKEEYFDFEAYRNVILPVFNREGVKSWDYNSQNYDKEHILTGKGTGGKKSSQVRNGKTFFIPQKDEVLAKKIMDEVNKVTKDYLAHNGNQIYDYNYKAYEEAKKKLRTKRPESALFRPILKGLSQNGWKRGLDFSITEDGYFFTIPPTEYNSIRIAPMENSILSSFIKGKRKDVKEEKK